MPNPIRTLEQTITWEQARLGVSRHDSSNDWSGGYDVDDCALFQSTAVFGEKAAWNVDVFMTLSGGTYYAGKAGMRRGDVVLYNWTGQGAPDHTEMCFTAPDKNGNFETIGANGSDTIAVAYRTRNGYVQGYFRPAYKPASTTASETATPLQKGTIVMKNYHYQDRRAKSLKPGTYVFQRSADNRLDQNIVGGVGPYSITPHLYADGLDEGDSLQIQLVWENTKNKPASSVQSAHYSEIVRANRDGVINHSVEFKRAVAAGDMVFVKITAPRSNKRTARITVLDSDAYLFG